MLLVLDQGWQACGMCSHIVRYAADWADSTNRKDEAGRREQSNSSRREERTKQQIRQEKGTRVALRKGVGLTLWHCSKKRLPSVSPLHSIFGQPSNRK